MNFSLFRSTSLQKRALSALILIPGSLFLVYLGGFPFFGFLGVLSGLIAFEWWQLSQKLHRRLFFIILGFVYLGIAMFSMYVIREQYGLILSILFMFMIWSSDSGAYFAGKILGGPKMIKEVSPNKTWSGLIGSGLSPLLVSFLYVLLIELIFSQAVLSFIIAGILGAVIGLIGQLGDLVISAIKRAANVKDTGNLIPGHGGLLDRMDSMILAAPVYLAALRTLV